MNSLFQNLNPLWQLDSCLSTFYTEFDNRVVPVENGLLLRKNLLLWWWWPVGGGAEMRKSSFSRNILDWLAPLNSSTRLRIKMWLYRPSNSLFTGPTEWPVNFRYSVPDQSWWTNSDGCIDCEVFCAASRRFYRKQIWRRMRNSFLQNFTDLNFTNKSILKLFCMIKQIE